VEEEGDARELRRTLASREGEVSALRNELDHTRAIHARTLANMESELQLAQTEAERQVEEERRNVEQAVRQVHELTTRSEHEREQSGRRIAELQQQLTTLQSERDEAVQAHRDASASLATVQAELDSLRTEHASSVATARTAYESLSTSSSEKYARLLQELKAYKIHTINAQVELRNELDALAATNARLEEEIKFGRPGSEERRILELASLQASRDEAVRAAENEAAQARQTLVEWRGKLEQVKTERDFLAQQLHESRHSASRHTVNLDYLKQVMVQFLGYQSAPDKQKAMFPVIAQLLLFNEQDHKAVAAAQAESSAASGLWGALTSLGGGGAGITTLRPGPASSSGPRKPLPPSMPMGIDLSDMGHASPFVATPRSASSSASSSAASAEPAAAAVAVGAPPSSAPAAAAASPAAVATTRDTFASSGTLPPPTMPVLADQTPSKKLQQEKQ
jgi:hypothetical protein